METASFIQGAQAVTERKQSSTWRVCTFKQLDNTQRSYAITEVTTTITVQSRNYWLTGVRTIGAMFHVVLGLHEKSESVSARIVRI